MVRILLHRPENVIAKSVVSTAALLVILAGTVALIGQPRGAAGAIIAIEEAAGGGVQQGGGRAGGGTPTGASGQRSATPSRQASGKTPSKTATTAPKAVVTHPAPRGFNGPVLGDKYSFLNFEVIEGVQPIHYIAVKNAGAKGLVQVEILVETDGRVISAHARTGNKLLWPEAERAAYASRLNRPIDNGRPARAIGFLVYRFGPGEDDD